MPYGVEWKKTLKNSFEQCIIGVAIEAEWLDWNKKDTQPQVRAQRWKPKNCLHMYTQRHYSHIYLPFRDPSGQWLNSKIF